MHALIIEDDALIAQLVEIILLDEGFASVDIAMTATEAVNSANRCWPALIVSDVELHESNGLEAVSLIQAAGTVPVIFVTGCPGEVQQRLPTASVLIKPFKTTELASLIQQKIQ